MTAPQITEDALAPKAKRRKMSLKKKLLIIVSIILALCIALVSAYYILDYIGEKKLRESLISGESVEAEEEEFDDDAVYFDGKPYYYNENLINILLMGVDRTKVTNLTRGQADAIYLVSADTVKNKVRIVSISRNTICDFDILGLDGKPFGTERAQICLSYAYANNNTQSSENCTRAVSRLLYNIPINGYYTVYLDTIGEIVNSVGGVTVTIPKDANVPEFADRLGKTVKLGGKESLRFLRMRAESNAPRVERHKEFIKSFISSAKSAVKRNPTLPFSMAKKLGKNAVTNIDVSSMVYLATEALSWELTMLNIKGEYGHDGKFETFEVDEAALNEMVLSNFYTAKSGD